MPIRGERVGQAYVRIFADGSEVPKGIRDSLDDADEDVRRKGKEHGDAYDEEFSKRTSQKDLGKGIRDALEKSFARADITDSYFGSRDWERFKKKIKTEFGESGMLAVNSMEDEFTKKGSLDGLENAVEGIHARVARATAALQKMEKQYASEHSSALKENYARDLAAQLNMLAEARAMNEKFDRVRAAMLDEAHRLNVKFDKDRLAAHRAMLAEAYQIDRDYDLKRARLMTEAYRMNAEFTRKRRADEKAAHEALTKELAVQTALWNDLVITLGRVERGEKNVGKSLRQIRGEMESTRARITGLSQDRGDTMSAEFERITERIRVLHPRVARMNSVFDNLATSIGKASGKGGRNDFINFMGVAAEGMVRLITLGPRLAASLGTKMADSFTKAGGGVSGVIASIGAIAPAFAIAGAGIAAVAVGMVVVLGPLVALLSGLLGIVTALASTITFALAGSVAILAGSLGALLLVGGAVTLAITQMDDALKNRLSDSLDGVKEKFSDLGSEAADVMFRDLPKNIRRLTPLIDTLRTPLVRVSRAVRDVGNGWTDAIDSPGFKRFVERVDKFLPSITRKLGRTFENTLGGLGGLFTGSLPSVEKFSKWIEGVTQDFQDWANSAKGQNEIKKFMDDAGESIEALGGFLEEALDLITELLDKGRENGDSIFKSMGDSIEKFTNYLKENPKALSDWFDNAEDLAKDIGDIAVALGKVFDALDSPESRQLLGDIIGMFEWFLDNGPLVPVLNAVADALMEINDALDAIGDGKMPKLKVDVDLPKIGSLVAPFAGLGAQILNKIGVIPLIRKINIPSIQSIANKFVGGAAAILRSIGDIKLWSRFNFPTLGEIAGKFAGGAARILGQIGNIKLWDNIDFPSLSDIASRFSGLAGAILRAIGPINVGSLITGAPGKSGGGGSKSENQLTPKSLASGTASLPTTSLSTPTFQTRSSGITTSSGRTIDATGWTIVTPSDPRAAAAEIVNALVATAF
jgi:hypothetical protein